MPGICAAISFIFILIAYKKYRNLINPLTAFSIVWCIIPLGAALNLYDLYSATTKTYFIIAIGILGFGIGSLFVINFHEKYYFKSELYSYKINYKVFNILLILTVIILVVGSLNSVKLLLQGYSINDIYIKTIQYNLGLENEMAQPKIIIILTTFLARPMLFLLIPLSIVYYFEKGNKKILIITTLMVMLDLLTKGGRILLIYIAVYFITTMKFYNKTVQIPKKIKKIIILCILGISLLVCILTIQRGSSIIKQMYIYPFGSVTHLSYRINNLGENNSFTYGLASIQGIIRPLINFMESIDIMPSLVELFSKAELYTYVEDGILIAPTIRYNAFVTLFYYFYVDGGYIGVLIGSLLYGAICQRFYNLAKKKMDIKSLTLYLLIFMQGILTSFIRVPFANISFSLALVYSLVIFKKNLFIRGKI